MIAGITGRAPEVTHTPGRKTDAARVVLDVSRARRYLGWRPTTDLETGVRRTWLWIQEQAKVAEAAAPAVPGVRA